MLPSGSSYLLNFLLFIRHPVFPVVLLQPFSGSNGSSAPPPPPTLAPTLDQAWQTVDQIIDQRRIRNRYHYLLRCRDKPTSEDTWRSLNDIPVSLEPLLHVFHRRYPRYPVPADLRPAPFQVRHLRDRVLVEARGTAGDVQQFDRSVLPNRAPPPRSSAQPSSSSAASAPPASRADPEVSSRVSASVPPTRTTSSHSTLSPPITSAAAQPPSPTSPAPVTSAPFASHPPAQGRVLRSRARNP
ncbi:hypothetical protein A4X09_0g7027 [Tilletia walkeri]|uniref:Chromo domain-containing protein n=1 Tax=Tilletia walkeri TaxID=117179 RepID=A0A8X7N2P7_9BASI|nr:hypothetical protein A4X09_0g7027 [Tilletia walkeri]